MFRFWITMALLVGAVSGSALAQDIGMACFVKGKPEVSHHGAPWEPLRLFRRLQVGDKIRSDAGGEAIVVVFGRGERFRVPSGQTADVAATGVDGAVSLGGLKGPSEHAARLLAGSSSGAHLSRTLIGMITRPSRNYPGWLRDGNRRVEWTEVKDAAYAFALYDRNDVLLWSARTKEPAVVIPDAIKLAVRTPYVWRINAFLANGLPAKNAEYRWGVLTFLTEKDIKEIQDLEKEMKPQIDATPTDPLPSLLLAERFREIGVLTRAWEVIDTAWEKQAINDSEHAQAGLEILNEIDSAARLSMELHLQEQSAPAEIGVKR